MKINVTINAPDGERELILRGRDAWAMMELVRAGGRGITSYENPAPRMSSYIHKLRKAGLDIETENEMHGGPFKGRHARYRLLSNITRCEVAQ